MFKKDEYDVVRAVAVIDRGLDKNDTDTRYVVVEGIDTNNDGKISQDEIELAKYGLTAEAIKLGAVQVAPKSSCVIAKNANAEKARNDQMIYLNKGDVISPALTNLEFELLHFLIDTEVIK